MAWLDALLGGAKALLTEVASVAGSFIREVIKEIDDTRIGRVIGRVAEAALDRLDAKASRINDEESEWIARAQRDGRWDIEGRERVEELRAERDRLREELRKARDEKAAADISEDSENLRTVDLTEIEVSANTDLVTSKTCPNCASSMTLRQGNFSINKQKRKFYWQCENVLKSRCPSITYDPDLERRSILRKANPDFDTDKAAREAIWNREDVAAKTHERLRRHLGEEDKEVVCPTHLSRMRMLPKRFAGGRMLDSYEYICLGVMPDGTACKHTVPVMSKPQVAELLRRNEGVGIIQ